MRFEWDENKAASNYRKHGVRLRDATSVFDDPDYFRENRTEDENGEERWSIVGRPKRSQVLVLFVIYAERGSDVVRIIMARRATTEETDDYHSRFQPLR